MARREPLSLWLHGVRVAELTSRAAGQVVCRYTTEALDRWPGNAPLLSCSLPLRKGPQPAEAFFSGLLPEGQHRRAMAALARVLVYDTFGLLERFGRDVAGAAIIAREQPQEHPGDVEPYTDDTLAAEVDALHEQPLALHEDSELSIAGLQDKMLLVRLEDGRWGRPVHGRPSTHILKVEDRRFPGMAMAEAACLTLARSVGLTTVTAQVRRIADLPCLIVGRFDREPAGDGRLARVHQEDACQALGRDPDSAQGRGKYERGGGPSLLEVAGLLDRYAQDPDAELANLVAAVTFTACIGNADAHGKNVALLHPTADHVRLAPLYDTVPTVLWPALRTEGAMCVGGRTRLDEVTVDDVVREARQWRMSAAVAERRVTETAERLLSACVAPELEDERVAASVQDRVKRLLART